MPDIITHYRFADAVYRTLPETLQKKLQRDIYDHTAAGPDVWFSYRFWNGKCKQGKDKRGGQMHREKTGEFLTALARQGKAGNAPKEMLSYLAGYLCHYALDQTAHPYIFYRTGSYEGTEQTKQYRGNHTLLERAIDHIYRKQWGVSMASAPITGKILRLRKIPDAMRADLDAVYREVYGWEGTSQDLDIAAADQRRFYFLAQDTTGLLNRVLHWVDNGTSRQELFSLSYSGRDQTGVDILNESHTVWKHPRDPEIQSDESFSELFEKAVQRAVVWILATDAYFAHNAPMPDFESNSYETGLCWQDARNERAPICDPLPLRKG